MDITSKAVDSLPRAATARPGILHRAARALVLRGLSALREGVLVVREGETVHRFGAPAADGLAAEVTVRDARFWSSILRTGSLGAGEAYIAGWWQADDLAAAVRLLVRNRAALDGLDSGVAKLSRPLLGLLHRANRNTADGSRRNIAAHYDTSNEFFAEWLDPTMTYSCAVWERGDESLEEAQRNKMERLCRKLGLQPGMHLLEIGTGWGGMAIHAAKHHGVKVTTTTISREQHDWAARRIAEEGLQDRVELLLTDYRELEGRYDRIVSVEMIEAVGAEFFETYFRQCGRLLKEDGLFAMQAITIADQHYEAARDSVDFIKRYIFPGSCIPSVGALTAAAAKAADFRLVQLEDFGKDYARTLRAWCERMLGRRERLAELGFDEAGVRLWEYYFRYCEGGFEERHISDVHLLYAMPGYRGRAPIAAMG
jgi:cyclopropane-fatty-acyl-phospholipid synthase